jgi:hypothetical protein
MKGFFTKENQNFVIRYDKMLTYIEKLKYKIVLNTQQIKSNFYNNIIFFFNFLVIE